MIHSLTSKILPKAHDSSLAVSRCQFKAGKVLRIHPKNQELYAMAIHSDCACSWKPVMAVDISHPPRPYLSTTIGPDRDFGCGPAAAGHRGLRVAVQVQVLFQAQRHGMIA